MGSTPNPRRQDDGSDSFAPQDGPAKWPRHECRDEAGTLHRVLLHRPEECDRMIPTRVLVAYASSHGSTREVAERVGAALRERGVDICVLPARDVGHLRDFDAVVLGGALYTGRLHRDARHFLEHHERALSELPFAVFALGPRTLSPADVQASRTQLEHALARAPRLAPVSVAIFGGAVVPDQLRFPFNRMAASDARDWDAIDAWAGELVTLLARKPAAVISR
jgi:menaquinone-dependent protoporphyrinogen oxidase